MKHRSKNSDRQCAFIALLVCVLFVSFGPIGNASAEDLPAGHNQDDLQANQVAREVLSGPDYWWKHTKDMKSSSLIAQAGTYLYEQMIVPVLKTLLNALEWILNKLFGRTIGFTGDWSQGIPFLWIIIALLLSMIIWRTFSMYRRLPTAVPVEVERAGVEELSAPDQLLEQARAAFERGDQRSAIRLTFLSLLAWLQVRGQLKYDSARSNREYEGELLRWPDSRACFRAVAQPFEYCWYGGHQLHPTQVQEAITLCHNEFQREKGNE